MSNGRRIKIIIESRNEPPVTLDSYQVDPIFKRPKNAVKAMLNHAICMRYICVHDIINWLLVTDFDNLPRIPEDKNFEENHDD